MEFLQNTFVTMFDGSPEKALRAVLVVMGCYVLTAAPLVAWVLYSLIQKDPKAKQQLETKAEPQPQVTASDTAFKLIKSRRSVFPKDYTGQLVSRSVLEQMLEAANWAPTHGRTEPWRFVVLSPDGLQEMISITDRVLRATLDDSAYAKKKAKLESKAALYPRATFIAICSLRQANPEKLQPEWEELAATSCAVQNLWLMGTALGVAGYWSSWQGETVCNSTDMKDLLGIGAEDKCLGFYLVGHSERTSTYRSKRGDMSDKVVWK
ncbi:hypothetical protein ABBQ38_002950 [Trebouxia sp. C0009 RCD-2024]